MNEDKPEKMPPVPPFVRFVASAVPMVFDDSLSYYEALCALWKYVQGMTDVINNNATLEEEYILKFDELKLFVDNYFDNLDVQEEINNKLDEMVEDGTLQEIITTYIQANVAWVFDTVADMKLSENLISGSYAQTLGFHTLNDGGGAYYYITDSGTANEMDVIEVGDLYANLVLPTTINPEIFGAYGDNTHDDTTVLQYCFDKHKKTVLTKTYATSNTITLGGYNNVEIDASSSIINYSGNSVAFLIQNINGGDIKFGGLNALSGGCIKMLSINGVSDRVIYLDLHFDILRASGKCIEIENENDGYVAEVRISGGEMTSGAYGIYVDNNDITSANAGSNGLYFDNIGFEGTDVNYHFESSTYKLHGIRITNDRFVENTTNTAFELVGYIGRFNMQSWSSLLESRLNITDQSKLINVKFDCPIMDSGNSQIVAQGLYINGNQKVYLHDAYFSQTPSNSSDVDSGSVLVEKIGNIVRVQINGITSSTKSSFDITASAINEQFRPTQNKTACVVSEDGYTARVWVRTAGTIAFSGAADGRGKAYYGEIVYPILT